jgi:hypothetical protein
MDLATANALWKLDLLSTEQMRKTANELLESGELGRDLTVLAGLSDSELSDAPVLFGRLVAVSEIPDLSRADAARLVASSVSAEIIRGDITPYEGALKLWRASLAVNDSNFHDLDPFIYVASEHENRPEDRDYFAKEIIKEAQRWMAA